MEAKAFALVVEKMRSWQKKYFRTRDTTALAMSRKYEELVDKLVAQILQEVNHE